MTSNLATYIALPGQTGDAFRHWHEVLGGELNILTYGEQPMDMGFEPDPNAVAHATLDLPGGSLAGGDAMPGETYPVRGSAYSLLYTLDSPEEAQVIIDKFVTAGGEVGMPFERAPWGQWYGQVFDKFGVMWALSVTPEGSGAE
ncbi:MAG: VOC family protein [Gulosibacter sp.]|uniref:VOC family protein n=1 Tax=Gulosibacter sp. TaxID=2817531 RepID=UPI003F8F288E